jgi:tetratricopeptide (TPR) repeat protein
MEMIARFLKVTPARHLFAVALTFLLVSGCASNSTSKSKSTAAPKTPPTKSSAHFSAKPRAHSKGDPSPTTGPQYAEVSDDVLSAYAHYAAGLSFDMRDESSSALEEYIKAAEQNPREEILVMEVARRLLRAKQNDRAIALLTKAAAEPTATGLVDSWLGLAYVAAGQTNKAVAANRASIQKLPTQITAYANLCELYLQTGKTNEITPLIDEALKQKDAPAEFYVNLAEIILRMQAKDVLGPDESKKRAVTALDKALAQKPDDLILRQRMADAYNFHGETAKAETILAKLYADHPEIPGLREKLINVYFRTNKSKAEAMLQELRNEAPTDPRPHISLGQLALDEDRLPEALSHFQDALTLDPNDETLYYRIAAIKVSMKKAGEALELLEKARAKFRPSFFLDYYTGITLSALERYSEALSALTSAELMAKTMEPQRLTAQFYFQLGSTSERAKDFDQAVKHFRHALELKPDFAEAENYLGYMWAERG